MKRGGHSVAITPRHYLDFINQFVNLYHEKRSDLEEQQLHLNVGLNKIAETVEQVEEMQKSLAVKSQELQTKNEAANMKLRQMVKDQNEAEQKKIQSQEIQAMIEKQTAEIALKKKDVMADLDQVEPAVVDAQQAVKGIKKQHLVELKSLGNPPAPVKLALEAICLLLGEATSDWKTIRSIVSFLSSCFCLLIDIFYLSLRNAFFFAPHRSFVKILSRRSSTSVRRTYRTASVSR